MKEIKELTVVIPVHNEKDSINDTINDVLNIMEKTDIAYEIIIVNDGSNDGTGDLLKKNVDKNEGVSECRVKVISHIDNKGYGRSLKTGIAKAKYNNICITDADLTYPNNRIPDLFYTLIEEGADMVVGARTGENVKIPMIRKPAKWIINKLANYLTGTRIPDLNSGLRVMRKGVVTKFINILPDGFSFTTTITLAMLTNNHSTKYIPIDYFKRKGKSKIRPIQDTLNFLQLIIRTILYFDPLKIFIPLSLILFIFSFFVLIFSYFLLQKVMDITVVILFVGGIHIMAVGMLADLIDRRLKN